ncbi:MAG: toll/interleukin-1 receptor domain-containing protein [Pseudomonadota bacterium]
MLWSGVQREKPRNARSTQSGADQARVFISYAREDIEVAQLVRSALLDEGVEVFLDTHDIAPGERWKDRIGALIAMAESVVFLVSPDAVVSKVAAWELDQAEAQGKRILPIVVRHTEQEAIPNRLQDLNHIHFIQRENLPQVLETLQVAISTDLVWERKRTRINDRAMTWDRRGRRLGLLTLEDDIRDAEMWRDTCPDTALAPTEVQLAFINASRNNRSKRQRNLVAGLSVTLAVVTCLAGLFFFQRDAAIKSERVATDRLGRVFMERASASFGSGNPWLAAKYALAATQFGESIASDHRHLITAIAEAIGPLTASLQQTDVFLDMQVGPTGEQFLTVSQDGAASLFDLAGNTIWRSQAHELAAADVALSPDGSQVVTSGYDSAVAILDMDSGAMVIDPKLFDLPVRMSLWSPDATTVLSVLSLEAFSGDAFELALWRVTDRETLWQISVQEPILSARFINEGQAVLTVSASGAISKIDAETALQLFCARLMTLLRCWTPRLIQRETSSRSSLKRTSWKYSTSVHWLFFSVRNCRVARMRFR